MRLPSLPEGTQACSRPPELGRAGRNGAADKTRAFEKTTHKEEHGMEKNASATAENTAQGSGLVRAKRAISAARERSATFDGGSTGRTDGND